MVDKNISDMYGDVGAFHERFGLDREGTVAPHLLPHSVLKYRVAFMQEELDEYVEAYDDGDLEKAADALCDLVYVALGTAHMMGLPLRECWAEVQRANTAKERASGAGDVRSVRKNSLDVVKPEGWRAPDHGPIIRAAAARFVRKSERIKS